MYNDALIECIDKFIQNYCELNQNQFRRRVLMGVKLNKEIFCKAIAINFKETYGENVSWEEVRDTLECYFSSDVPDEEGSVWIKQAYLRKYDNKKIELLPVRCLYIYQEGGKEVAANILMETFIDLKYFCDFQNEDEDGNIRVDEERRIAIWEIAEELRKRLQVHELSAANIMSAVEEAIDKYSQILKPTTEYYSYNKQEKLLSDEYVALFCNVIGGGVYQ